MSQFAGPSQSHSDESSLHYHRCWWVWCRHNFYTRKELVDHVKTEHVAKARPVPIADVPALQKAEHGYWESLDISPNLSSLPSSSNIQQADTPRKGGRREVNAIDPYPSSLPSPPASSAKPDDSFPSSLPSPPASTPHEIPCTPVRVGSPVDPEKTTDSSQVLSNLAASSQSLNGLPTPLSKHNIFDVPMSSPSFTLLSSQSNSPNKPIYAIPDSPCFSDLVAGNARQPMHIIPDIEGPEEAALSPEEDSSQEFVFNHLTQEIDDDESGDKLEAASGNGVKSMVIDSQPAVLPDEHRPTPTVDTTSQRGQPDLNAPTARVNAERPPPSLTPLQIQPSQASFIASTTSPSFLYSPAYPITTPVARQSWYQPRRRRSSKMSTGQVSPATSPLAKSASPVISPVPANFLPAAVQATLQPEEESWSQTDSGTQISSYPPLQTQAPYRSQSLNQD